MVPVGYMPNMEELVVGKVYNGSSYVDCNIYITAGTSGATIKVTNLFGNAIPSIDVRYLTPKTICYVTADDWPA